MAKGFSKEIVARNRSSESLLETINTNTDAIATKLEATLEPFLEKGEKMPNARLLCQLIARAIGTKAEAMNTADQTHEAEMADDAAPRAARDKHKNEVKATLVRARLGVESVYGAPGLAALGLAAAIPTDAQALVKVGQKVLELSKSAKLVPLPDNAVSVDLKRITKLLSGQVENLSAALKDVAREKREGEATLTGKTEATDDYDYHFQRGAWIIESLALLAGMDDVAKRARPSTRKAGQTADEEGTDEGEEGTGEEGGEQPTE